MRRRKWFLIGGLSLTLLLITILPAMAQTGALTKIPVSLRYPVKFICGPILSYDFPDAFLPLPKGRYHTAVNVHNPSLTAPVTFGKKMSLSSFCYNDEDGYSQHPGPVSNFIYAKLDANQAFEIDCFEIFYNFDICPWCWVEGFVVLMSPVELDVTAVYAARPTGCDDEFAQVSSIDVETIQSRPQQATITLYPSYGYFD